MGSAASRVREPSETSEGDSPFLSAADFFSLISLTLIYVVVVLATPSMPGTNAINWVNAAQQISGSATNKNLTFIVFTPERDGVQVRILRERTKLNRERLLPLTPKGEVDAKRWAATVLHDEPPQERVVFHLSVDEERPQAHKLFNELLRATQEAHPTTQAFTMSSNR